MQLFLKTFSGMTGAVWSGSALFAYVILSATAVYKILEHLPYCIFPIFIKMCDGVNWSEEAVYKVRHFWLDLFSKSVLTDNIYSNQSDNTDLEFLITKAQLLSAWILRIQVISRENVSCLSIPL